MPDSQSPQQHQSPLAGTVYEIRWKELCPWLILLKALRVTLMIRVLLLATVGMLLTLWGEAALDKMLLGESISLAQTAMPDVASQFHKLDPSSDQPKPDRLIQRQTGEFLQGWQWVEGPFVLLANPELSSQSSWVLLLHGVWKIVVWGVFGGAIARIAAVFLTRGKTLGPLRAIRDATTVWPGTVGAPLIVLCVAGALGGPLVLLGSLFRFQVVAVITGILWCMVLVLGFVLAVVLLGLLLGWPLMWACLSVERSDAFDGVSRCYAYVYQRPLHFAFYVLVATLLSMLGKTVVDALVSTTFSLSEGFFLFGTGSRRLAELLGSETSRVASQAINGWKWGLTSLGAAYPLACLWPMAVGIYLLLRRHIDATEMDEITLPAASPKSPPAPDPTHPA